MITDSPYKPPYLFPDEKLLIEAYRKATPEEKKMIENTIIEMLEKQKSEED